MYLNDELNRLKEDKYNKHKNRMINIAFFPIVIRDYVKLYFHSNIIHQLKQKYHFTNKYLYFIIAAFLLPK